VLTFSLAPLDDSTLDPRERVFETRAVILSNSIGHEGGWSLCEVVEKTAGRVEGCPEINRSHLLLVYHSMKCYYFMW
jgi:hypothetical protein